MKEISDEKVIKELKASDGNGINLDDLRTNSEADLLWAVGRFIERNPKRSAKILFPHRPKGYVRAARALGRYAENKATAMRCRLPGGTGVVAAQGYETICEHIYEKLDVFARW